MVFMIVFNDFYDLSIEHFMIFFNEFMKKYGKYENGPPSPNHKSVL